MAHNVTQLKRVWQVPISAGVMMQYFAHASSDAAASVAAAGFFNASRAKLKVHDIIFSLAGHGATPILQILRVTAVPSSGNVTVSLADDFQGGQTAIPDLDDDSGGVVDAENDIVAVGSTHDVDRSVQLNANFATLAADNNLIKAALRSAGVIEPA